MDAIPLIKKFKEVKKFIKTRRAILQAEPLYLRSQDELKSGGYMGPWAFNAAQSLIDSIPGMIISVLLWVFFASETPRLLTLADPITTKIAAWISPLKGPFTLLALVYVVGFASVPAGYMSRRALHAVARKYLYFDAALGLWAQLSLATCLALLSIPPTTVLLHPAARYISEAGAGGLLITVVWQGIITGGKIRLELFEFDYLDKEEGLFGSIVEAPLVKFFALTTFLLPFVIAAINWIFSIITLGLTNIVHMLRV